MMETFLIITIAAAIGLYHDTNKPTQYELNMEDGSKTQVILQKNSSYACPVYCEVEHIHHAVSCGSTCHINHENYHLHNMTQIEKGIATFCSKKIVTMSRISAKKKLPDVVSASK